ncbi:hypothetical protein BerOc1_03072 [Pseudodesulfovibrio hydrargyri]|uniref:DUF4145 domain-containing protein n=1 Tax=Pseudodesulfovibrio hydrargyri TaxID=2125990 RepID=A0A1J5ND19_9BACT|nr:hypothetical protein [Pseudodesulfovibrio hydrargyri]OIQ51127.1 hypothetical protein BerOc1_03072 [Pseudodesulfovibrio hydrargyri]
MGLFDKILDGAQKLKDVAIEITTEEVPVKHSDPIDNSDTENISDNELDLAKPQETKRVAKKWVKTTGKAAAALATLYLAKKGYDKTKDYLSSDDTENRNTWDDSHPQNDSAYQSVADTRNYEMDYGNWPSNPSETANSSLRSNWETQDSVNNQHIENYVSDFFAKNSDTIDSKWDYKSYEVNPVDLDDTSLDNLIKSSAQIEGLLESNGAIGRGLHEKVSSVETMIPNGSVKAIRFIASIRNKLVHEGPDSVSSETKEDFLAACDRVLDDLSD